MPLISFEEFRAEMLARGFHEVLERKLPPGMVLETHTHPFDADAVVTAGEIWLAVDGSERRLVAGDTFQVARGTPHAERYGAQGASYLVARRR